MEMGCPIDLLVRLGSRQLVILVDFVSFYTALQPRYHVTEQRHVTVLFDDAKLRQRGYLVERIDCRSVIAAVL